MTISLNGCMAEREAVRTSIKAVCVLLDTIADNSYDNM